MSKYLIEIMVWIHYIPYLNPTTDTYLKELMKLMTLKKVNQTSIFPKNMLHILMLILNS